MLEFHAPTEQPAPAARLVQLLQEFRAKLEAEGMASIDEYGDMLKWGLPKEAGVGRSFHIFHPDFCSYSDAFYGTIHYHGGWVRGTVLAGGLEHITYKATPTPNGDRFLDGQAYTLEATRRNHMTGATYTLPAMTPHWVKPLGLTLTMFEEEDNDRMGDLLNPANRETDHHIWEQENADALLPDVLALIDARIEELTARTAA